MIPLRGEIWLIKLDPTQGSEIKKTRPCLVLSNDHHHKVNRVLMVIPITTKIRYPSNQVRLDTSTGIDHESCLEIPQMRSADKKRLIKKIGSVSSEKLKEIFIKLNLHLGFASYLKRIDFT